MSSMMLRNRILVPAVLAALVAAGCDKPVPPPPYIAMPVSTRDIIVSVQASGTIQPDTTVEVKSQASGEILDIKAQTGQLVHQGELLMRIDPRIPTNNLDQAKANFEVAQARLDNALAQKQRSDELYKQQAITQTEHDTAVLDYANAKAAVVSARVAMQNAQIVVDQTDVRAPITGTVIQLDVQRGQVIASSTSNVSGGTVLLQMADLNHVQVSTLVDETDIGKIRPGLEATVTVDAYPNRPFQGEVIKIEPQATTTQNVTMFPVLVRIDNREGMLRPGMNSEVEIHVGQRRDVVAVPTSALRTQRDVGSAAQVLGLDPATVQKELAQASQPRQDSLGASGPGKDSAAPQPAGNVLTLPNGATVALPEGVTEKQVQDILKKRMSGGKVSADESALLRKVFAGMRGNGGGRGGRPAASGTDFQFGGRYVVFVKKNGSPQPTWVQTGLTDLDYSEVTSGLAVGDTVLLLPSASLVQSQEEFKNRIERITGGGTGGLRSNSSSTSSGGSRPSGGR